MKKNSAAESRKKSRPSKAPPAPPCVMVIFGGGGDLAKRKLVPALYYLSLSRLLPERFAVIGVGADDHTSESYREYLERYLSREGYDVRTAGSGREAIDVSQEFDPEILLADWML